MKVKGTHTLCRHKRFNAHHWTQKVKQKTQRQHTDTQKGTNTTRGHKGANSKTHTHLHELKDMYTK